MKARGDAFFGDGTYVTHWDPQDFGCKEAVVYNNYKRFKPKDSSEEVDNYLKCVDYCIPIVCDEVVFYDIRVNSFVRLSEITELREHAKRSLDVRNKFSRLLNFGRDVCVIRVEGTASIENACGRPAAEVDEHGEVADSLDIEILR